MVRLPSCTDRKHDRRVAELFRELNGFKTNRSLSLLICIETRDALVNAATSPRDSNPFGNRFHFAE